MTDTPHCPLETAESSVTTRKRGDVTKETTVQPVELSSLKDLREKAEKIAYHSSQFLMHEKGGVTAGICNRLAEEAEDILNNMESRIATKREIVGEAKPVEFEGFGEWQPVETAPEGVPVLVFGSMGMALSWKHGDLWSHNWKAPTHWMPMPNPPTTQIEGDQQ